MKSFDTLHVSTYVILLEHQTISRLVCSLDMNTQNRLSRASSPYLKQHADNPVDWYEWGEEALLKARTENKPLIISIGYAACHWCHVMAQESFMDKGIAQLMNTHFVCIKIDREERPDIDRIYMEAAQLISGRGGVAPQCLCSPRWKTVSCRHLLPARSVDRCFKTAKSSF